MKTITKINAVIFIATILCFVYMLYVVYCHATDYDIAFTLQGNTLAGDIQRCIFLGLTTIISAISTVLCVKSR